MRSHKLIFQMTERQADTDLPTFNFSAFKLLPMPILLLNSVYASQMSFIK